MQTKFTRYALFIVVAGLILAGAFSSGMIVGWAMPDQNLFEMVTPMRFRSCSRQRANPENRKNPKIEKNFSPPSGKPGIYFKKIM
jgi:hypothetical protein